MLKLNIGGGDSKLEGYICIDRKSGGEALPLKMSGFDVADNSVDAIRASHILEHFTIGDAIAALVEWMRALKPGGLIEIAVPDFDKIAQAKKDGDPLWHFYASGGQMDANDVHKSSWDYAQLAGQMKAVGFEDLKTWDGDKRDSSSHKVSLNISARKPLNETIKPQSETHRPFKVKAIMSCPRLGWNDFWGEAIVALQAANIGLGRFQGAFWGQGVQNCIEDAIKEGYDAVITLDYDSVFTKEDLERLVADFLKHEDCDAMAALQVKRGPEQQPLLTIRGKKAAGITHSLEPFEVNTAHFGLTIIDLRALENLPKPWFIPLPGSTGSWRDDDRCDEDIYFWRMFEKHGLKVKVNPAVSIGHLEVMVSEFGPDFKQRHVHVKQWREARQLKGKTE